MILEFSNALKIALDPPFPIPLNPLLGKYEMRFFASRFLKKLEQKGIRVLQE
ncbi:hypothetical protein GF312_20940 [Candidatus Poribacteria bacterium]|nr:hypothetical protein [Candidatus Poribacteria bacterium]